MKGLFIPNVTAEMFRNGCLESIEVVMAEGEIYDIDYKPESQWIPCSERTPEVNEEAYSNGVLVSLRKTVWDIDKCQMIHITKMAYYDVYAISSDGIYKDTEGWILNDGKTLSMDEVIAWMPMPDPYSADEEEINVGDEVWNKNGDCKAVVMDQSREGVYFVWTENGCIEEWERCEVVKSGKHHDEVAELIEKLRKEE